MGGAPTEGGAARLNGLPMWVAARLVDVVD